MLKKTRQYHQDTENTPLIILKHLALGSFICASVLVLISYVVCKQAGY